MKLCKSKGSLSALFAALSLSLGFAAASPAQAADAHFVLISHAPDSDSWWNTIKNAIKQADEDFNVETDYRNPPNGDIADMSRLIEQSAARSARSPRRRFHSSRSTRAPRSRASSWARSCTSASLNMWRARPPAKKPRPPA
jgi:hypothetical protein